MFFLLFICIKIMDEKLNYEVLYRSYFYDLLINKKITASE